MSCINSTWRYIDLFYRHLAVILTLSKLKFLHSKVKLCSTVLQLSFILAIRGKYSYKYSLLWQLCQLGMTCLPAERSAHQLGSIFQLCLFLNRMGFWGTRCHRFSSYKHLENWVISISPPRTVKAVSFLHIKDSTWSLRCCCTTAAIDIVADTESFASWVMQH